MLITIRGMYRHGQIELDDYIDAPDNTPVIVTFLTPDEINLLEDRHEAELLAQSPIFHRLTKRTLSEIEAGETLPFEDILNDLSD